jgi:tetratricopeptide (TPR) repeat protein
VNAWLRPETYAIARERLEHFDPSTLNGGLGSELRLANVAFYELRLARDREKAVDAARRALASGRLGELVSTSFHFGVYTLLGAGLFDEALAAYDWALADAQRRSDVLRLAACLVFCGRCRTLRGELDAALGDLRESFDLIREHGVQAMLGYATGLLALAQLEGGDLDGAAETIGASGFPEELPARIVINFFQIARGRLRIETGEVERGVGDLLAVGRRCLEIPSEAVELLEGTGARLQQARALLDLGVAQRLAGRRTLARERLREAADLVLAGGMLSLAERATKSWPRSGRGRARCCGRASTPSRRASAASPSSQRATSRTRRSRSRCS